MSFPLDNGQERRAYPAVFATRALMMDWIAGRASQPQGPHPVSLLQDYQHWSRPARDGRPHGLGCHPGAGRSAGQGKRRGGGQCCCGKSPFDQLHLLLQLSSRPCIRRLWTMLLLGSASFLDHRFTPTWGVWQPLRI